jgi:tetratricopeptide (TPR) repeat protein
MPRNGAHLLTAIDACNAALTVYTPETTPKDWAMTQNNLGTALQALGKQEDNSARLQAAIDAFSAAVTVYTPVAAPMDRGGTQMNLGYARGWLGTITSNAGQCDGALVAYQASLRFHTRTDTPFDWAKTQWNLADLALARHALAPDPALPFVAQGHLDAARVVFAEDENTHQLAQCDRLQALINAT